MRTLAVGDPAPDFDLPDHDGRRHRLGALLHAGPVVLFFYPAASSPGCTREACHFRDLAGEFAAVGAQRVGISADGVDAQHGFATAQRLDYPLLSDPDGDVASAYGVRRKHLMPVKRVTFVIGTDQRIREVVSSELNFSKHADRALAALTDR